MLPGYLTTKEAAARANVSQAQITYLVRKGIIKAQKVSLMWLVDSDSLYRYLATNPKPGPKPKSTSKRS